MSNLPCELLDHIVDLLQESQAPLKNCCLVSKSWVARTRRQLFAEVDFETAESLESWKKTFPDPSTSPSRYVKTLVIRRPQVVTAVDAEAGCWVGGFPRLVRLVVFGRGPQRFARGWGDTFTLFRGISPVIKSLRVDFVLFPFSQLFDLILSFPLLEDLSVTNCLHFPVESDKGSDGLSTPAQPSSFPVFSGSLELDMKAGMEHIGRRLLSLSGGMRFRKFILRWTREEDIPLTAALVERCSRTLKSLDITHNSSGADPRSALFDLSKATKLEDAVFRPGCMSVDWITLALRAITPEHRDLRRISVDLPYYLAYTHVDGDLSQALGEGVLEQWLVLDRTLAHLWESLSIHTNVLWPKGKWDGIMGDYAECLLPEMAKRGMVTINLIR